MTTFSGLFGGGGGAGQVSAPHMGYRSGGYYLINPARVGASATGSTELSSGSTHYTPFYVHSDISVSGLCFFNSSSGESGKKGRVGIYANDGGRPGSLIVSSGEITLDGTSALREAAISQPLAKGWYWAAIITDGLSVYRFNNADMFDGAWSMASPAPDGTAAFRTSITGTYGALPASAVQPTSTGVTPIIYIKVA